MQSCRELQDGRQARLLLAQLQQADIGSPQIGLEAQLLLGEAGLSAHTPQYLTERLPCIHRCSPSHDRRNFTDGIYFSLPTTIGMTAERSSREGSSSAPSAWESRQ
ncbi:protein of unknown function [Thauera humireducens]|nr:protein of unknown function [Thauera humireducens]